MTHAGLVIDGAEPALAAARATFDRVHCLRLEGFVDRSLLAAVQRELARASFYDRTHDGIGTELCLSEGPLSSGLEFLWNAPAVLHVMHRLTGSGPYGCFEGRVYRMKPGTGHYDSWHSDVGQDRQVAMSVNLSEGVYDGGTTEFRRADAQEPFHRIANVGFGDAILFRIDPALRHQVTEITGIHDKTAYAGWFRTQPDFRSLFADRHGGL